MTTSRPKTDLPSEGGDNDNVKVCTPKRLPPELWLQAARKAVQKEPRNAAPVRRLLRLMPEMAITPQFIAVVTDRKWPTTGVKLTVSFPDAAEAALRTRIISHMNAWSKTANVQFVETAKEGQVRIAREAGKEGGYWSYLGTEIEEIEMNRQTMNLEDFTMKTPD